MTQTSSPDSKQIEQQLRQRRAALIQRLDAIQADFRRGRSADSEDQAQERENEEALNVIETESQSELTAIDRALEKLEHGSYGHCDTCGKTIEAKRLAAVPHAINCLNCA